MPMAYAVSRIEFFKSGLLNQLVDTAQVMKGNHVF